MTLCSDCAKVADSAMVTDRISERGIPKREDNKWAQRYNAAHKKHTGTAPKRKRKVAA